MRMAAAAPLLDALDARAPAQETLGRAPLHVDAPCPGRAPCPAPRRVWRRSGRRACAAPRAPRRPMSDRLRGGAVDAPLLHLAARCAGPCRSRRSSRTRRRSCGRRAPSTSRSAPCRRRPRGRARRTVVRGRAAGRRRRRSSSAPRGRRGPSCRRRPRARQVRGGHQRLDRVAAADLERHDAAKCVARVLLLQLPRRGRCCGCR